MKLKTLIINKIKIVKRHKKIKIKKQTIKKMIKKIYYEKKAGLKIMIFLLFFFNLV